MRAGVCAAGLAAFATCVVAGSLGGQEHGQGQAAPSGLTIVVVDEAPCRCHPYLDHGIPWLSGPKACQLRGGALVDEFDYVWGGEVPGTGALTPGRCEATPRCSGEPTKCSWPSYRIHWVAAVCAQGGAFTSYGPGGGQIGQPFAAGQASATIVFSPTTKECGSAAEVLVSSVNHASDGKLITRVEVTTRCRQCRARE